MPSSPRVTRFAPAALTLALALSACEHQSVIVLTLRAEKLPDAPAQALRGVTKVVVTVNNGPLVETLTYPADNLTIDDVTGKTLSVTFSGSRVGEVIFAVAAHGASGCLGADLVTALIKKGAAATLAVTLSPRRCPPGGVAPDGGADGDANRVDLFPGCDPAALTCGANMTCHVDCTVNQGSCTAAGSGGHGSACQGSNANCMPGSQCFDYGALGCNVTTCLKFCKTDDDCAGQADGGVGGRGLCVGDVQCGGRSSGHRTCSFDCDPRGAATTGCPGGLTCFMVRGVSDQVDCSCAGPARVKQEGQDCPSAGECAPGLVCNEMGTVDGGPNRKCRKICRRSDGDADCAVGQVCTMQTTNAIYGVCL